MSSVVSSVSEVVYKDEAKKFQETHEVIWSLMFLGFGELFSKQALELAPPT